MERLQICVRSLSFGQAACGVPLIQAVPIRKTNPLDVVFSTFEKSIILTKRQKGLESDRGIAGGFEHVIQPCRYLS